MRSDHPAIRRLKRACDDAIRAANAPGQMQVGSGPRVQVLEHDLRGGLEALERELAAAEENARQLRRALEKERELCEKHGKYLANLHRALGSERRDGPIHKDVARVLRERNRAERRAKYLEVALLRIERDDELDRFGCSDLARGAITGSLVSEEEGG